MATTITPVRLDELDKASLRELAARLRISQSGVIRSLVRETLAILKEQDEQVKLQKQNHPDENQEIPPAPKWRRAI